MKIALLGDIAFYGKYSLDNKEYAKQFTQISNFLKKFDIVVGNLETPFCNECKPTGSKSAHIKSNEENVKLLKLLNIKLVNLSNNHMLDYGQKGLKKTLSLLDENNIDYFGIDDKMHSFKLLNSTINFFGYTCTSTNLLSYSKSRNKYVNILKPYKIESDLKKIEDKGVNIISLHMGTEHINYPSFDHVKMARKLAENHDYILYGHHPHVVQGIEKWNESILAYSLGNFCFDDVYNRGELKVKQSINNKTGCILVLEIQNNVIKNYKTQFIYQNSDSIDLIDYDISEFNSMLELNERSYKEKRKEQFIKYYEKEKSKRHFTWYLKRLNYRTLKILINAWKNKKLYHKYITNYIEREE